MKTFYLLSLLVICVRADYDSDRKRMISNEGSMALGGSLILSAQEKKANDALMKLKYAELDEAYKNPDKFPPARSFFVARADIEKSEVFKFLQKVPKGGVLHLHDSAATSVDFVVSDLSYRENLYVCITDDKITEFRFADPKPAEPCWDSVKSLREKSADVAVFDAKVRSVLTLETDDPKKRYPDINSIWKEFQIMFGTILSIILYKPAFFDYYYNTLDEFYKDNVKYIEFRTSFPTLYELDGTKHPIFDTVDVILSAVKKFKDDHPDFIGAKFIYSKPRFFNEDQINEAIETFKKLKAKYPDDIIGFDLVGQEDSGKPLYSFLDKLKSLSTDTHFFFHAGETDWNGMSTDLNLMDAILLNTTRIGHAYAVVKHPVALQKIKLHNIGIELNPISNQVLMLVEDLRNHPASFLLAENFPVVVAADDPGFWSAKGLSYDLYEVFMGMASRDADLRMLKKLALNSFQYSGLTPNDKAKAITNWQKDWDNFILSFKNV